MSHHVSVSASNPTGAVEVVRVSNSSTTTAPVDTGSAAGASAPVAQTTSAPVSSVVGGQPSAGGQSGLPGANLPVDGIQQASNTIQNAQADLSRTAGAERRLDGFDLVGGGGGGGGGAGQENANNAEGAVAQNTDGLVVDQTGVGGETLATGEEGQITSTADVNPNQSGQTDPNSTALVNGQA